MAHLRATLLTHHLTESHALRMHRLATATAVLFLCACSTTPDPPDFAKVIGRPVADVRAYLGEPFRAGNHTDLFHLKAGDSTVSVWVIYSDGGLATVAELGADDFAGGEQSMRSWAGTSCNVQIVPKKSLDVPGKINTKAEVRGPCH
jgi:hypothetical protein